MHQKRIVTLAAVVMVLLVLMSGYEPELFFLRLYQAGIYLLIILLFFYFEDRWGFMIGILAPIVGILVSFAIGSLSDQVRSLGRLLTGHVPANPTPILGALATLCGIALAIFSYRAFHKEVGGTTHARPTFWGCLGVVVIYYAVWFFWYLKSARG